jgi:large subunit ribosomal protein L10
MVSDKNVAAKKHLDKILKSHKSVLIFDMTGLPSGQLHEIRNNLKEKEVYTYIAKKRVLEKAIKDAKLNLKVEGVKQPALIYSNKAIFDVAKLLNQVKTKRKAKAGEECPDDITLPAGPTPAQAGPAISIFKTFLIQTMIKDGKISIREPKTVCKKGDKVPEGLISLLNMLGITPIEMFISPKIGVYENVFYTPDVFSIDEAFVRGQVLAASGKVMWLTYGLGYPTKQNANLLLAKGWRNAKTLGIKTGMPAKDIMGDLIRVAHSGAKKLEK